MVSKIAQVNLIAGLASTSTVVKSPALRVSDYSGSAVCRCASPAGAGESLRDVSRFALAGLIANAAANTSPRTVPGMSARRYPLQGRRVRSPNSTRR